MTVVSAPASRPGPAGSGTDRADPDGWRAQAVLGTLVAGYSVLAGGAVGLLWQAVATRIRLADAAGGSGAATKALLDDDMQLAVLGLAAGAVLAVLAVLVARRTGRGPGAAVGLAVGGVVGAIVAAHVGAVARQDQFTLAALNARFPGNAADLLRTVKSSFEFRVRALGVLLVWPITAVAVHGAICWFAGRATSGDG